MRRQRTFYNRESAISWIDSLSKAFEIQTIFITVERPLINDWSKARGQKWKVGVRFQ